MLDDITIKDHPPCLASYVAFLFVLHFLCHRFLTNRKFDHSKNAGNGNNHDRIRNGVGAVNRHKYSNKVVGTAHALVLAFGAVRCYLTKGFDLHAERLLETPPFEHLTVGFMLVYLIYDTSFLFWRTYILQPSHSVNERWTFGEHTLAVVHHLFGFISWWLIYCGTGGVYWAQLIHIAELSTPLLNVRWIMIKEGVRSGPVYLALSGAFLVVFFFSRIPTTAVLLCFMWRSIDKWPSRTIAYFQIFVTFGFWIINLIWFSSGVQMAIRALSGKGRSKAKKNN